MSTTATAEFSSPTTFLNTDPDMKLESGTFTFIDPDTSTDPWECDYFANPTPKEIIHQRVPLHNLRADPHLFTPESSFSLTTNGFTVVKHVSTIQSLTDFKNPENLEGTYFPEIKSLLKSVTGASEVHVINCALRLNHAEPPLRTAAQQAEDPSTQPDKGGLKLDVASMDFSKALIGGIIETQKFGPARVVHIDYSPVGVNKTLRSTHAEISDSPAVQDVIAAEDEAAEKGESYAGRRFGLYSVWRPLKPVRSNPIAVCDPRSINPERDLVEHLNKQVGHRGDYVTGLYMVRGAHVNSQKWYYLKDQQPDEALVIQFFDSESVGKEGRVMGTPHGSPEGVGEEGEEPRQSVEVRCLAVW